MIKENCSIDVVFCVDCTKTMAPYIRQTSAFITQFAQLLRGMNANMQLRVGFAGYRDHCDVNHRFEVFPFSSDLDAFAQFVASVKDAGGGDLPEDVLGGLVLVQQKFNFTARCRLLLHIADAPCHGTQYHSEMFVAEPATPPGRCPTGSGRVRIKDDYPQGCPLGLTPRDILPGLRDSGIRYYFVKINDSTDQMVRVFNEEAFPGQSGYITTISLVAPHNPGGSGTYSTVFSQVVDSSQRALPTQPAVLSPKPRVRYTDTDTGAQPSSDSGQAPVSAATNSHLATVIYRELLHELIASYSTSWRAGGHTGDGDPHQQPEDEMKDQTPSTPTLITAPPSHKKSAAHSASLHGRVVATDEAMRAALEHVERCFRPSAYLAGAADEQLLGCMHTLRSIPVRQLLLPPPGSLQLLLAGPDPGVGALRVSGGRGSGGKGAFKHKVKCLSGRGQPFGRGSTRTAYYALSKESRRGVIANGSFSTSVVVHKLVPMESDTAGATAAKDQQESQSVAVAVEAAAAVTPYLPDLVCVRAAAFLAGEFNRVTARLRVEQLTQGHSQGQNVGRSGPLLFPFIEFNPACLLEYTPPPPTSVQFCHQEAYLDGIFEKFNSNSGYVLPSPSPDSHCRHEILQAFSHWTHVHTHGLLMVVDLQGVFQAGVSRFVLTDPALHCESSPDTSHSLGVLYPGVINPQEPEAQAQLLRFGSTNHGIAGFKRFYNTHKCNIYCRHLGIDGIIAHEIRTPDTSGKDTGSADGTQQCTVS
mgnify:CR=1 FL=1